MKISWFSAGVSSFVATWLVRKELDEIIYTHIDDQHPDTLRFIADCERALERKITILRSEYFTSVEQVCRHYKFVSSPRVAKCTEKLKKEVRRRWEYEHPGQHAYYWGMDIEEKGRAESLKESMPDFEHPCPLIERDLTKQDCHAIAHRLGIKRPIMYDLGYHNNNCIACVKGGMGYWNRIRKDFPAAFAARAKMERDIGHSCINGVYLDELNPNAGRHDPPITQECGIYCMLTEPQKEAQDDI